MSIELRPQRLERMIWASIARALRQPEEDAAADATRDRRRLERLRSATLGDIRRMHSALASTAVRSTDSALREDALAALRRIVTTITVAATTAEITLRPELFGEARLAVDLSASDDDKA
jgi:hypothetical protein